MRKSGSCLWLVRGFSFLTFFYIIVLFLFFVWIVCFQLFAGKYDDSKHDDF